jgi:hypothetical protein
MWPALIFAASRNDSVRGRTVILVVSINTRKGFSQSGAPSGRKWAMNILGNFTSLDIIIDIHKGNPRDRVKIRWLDNLNWYGASPRRLIMIIIMNKAEMLLFSPFKCDEKVRESWAIIVSLNIYRTAFNRLAVGQYESWINKIRSRLIIKNIGVGRMELNDAGSKAEKISDIIQNMDCSI